jgi:hypothetical protein
LIVCMPAPDDHVGDYVMDMSGDDTVMAFDDHQAVAPIVAMEAPMISDCGPEMNGGPLVGDDLGELIVCMPAPDDHVGDYVMDMSGDDTVMAFDDHQAVAPIVAMEAPMISDCGPEMDGGPVIIDHHHGDLGDDVAVCMQAPDAPEVSTCDENMIAPVMDHHDHHSFADHHVEGAEGAEPIDGAREFHRHMLMAHMAHDHSDDLHEVDPATGDHHHRHSHYHHQHATA